MSQPSPKRTTQAIVLSVVILALAGVLLWLSTKPGPAPSGTGVQSGGPPGAQGSGQPSGSGNAPINVKDPNSLLGVSGKIIMPADGKLKQGETMGTPPRTVFIYRDGSVELTVPSINFTHQEPELFLGTSNEDFSFLTQRPPGLKLPATANIKIVRKGYKTVELNGLAIGDNGMITMPDVHLEKQ